MGDAPRTLAARLDDCMIVDRRRLRARLRALDRARSPDPQALDRITQDIERSAARRAARAASLPTPEFPAALPVSEKRDDIAAAIAAHQVVIVCGETGSGKTTQLPKICLALGRGAAGLIGHTQPRRIAARAVAARVAEELGSRLTRGPGPVGYKVRFTYESHPTNVIKLMTDGILLAETQGDPLLELYDTIIIDEAHERSLNIDFLLGYLRQLLPRRPDLKVIVTSATIDPQRFADHFAGPAGPAPIIEVSGRVYPVSVRYRPIERDPEFADEDIDEDEPDLQQAILRAVDELTAPGMPGGDILLFLSGEREIRETAETLREHGPRGLTVLPLYARLSSDEQQRVFQVQEGQRRIILATNVAETSLTVPGIRYVIDPGFARISRYSPRTKVQRLPIEKVSRASADQRKGRCGRLSDGVCIRLYSEKDYLERPQFTDPEIQRTNLASVILQMASLKLGRVDRFPFVQPPDPRMVRDGFDTLVELGAVAGDPDAHDAAAGDPGLSLTPVGRSLARLPVDPRIGRIILAGQAEACLPEAIIVAAALSVQDPRERPIDQADKADQAHALFRDEQSDFMGFVKLWRAYHEQARLLSGSRLRKWCKEHFISFVRMREWHDVHAQLKELSAEIGLAPDAAAPAASSEQPRRGSPQPPAPAAPTHGWRTQRPAKDPEEFHRLAPLHRAVLTGLLSSIGKLPDQPEKGAKLQNRFEYHGPRGLRFNIFPGSGVFKKNPKWLVAAEIVKTTRVYARTVGVVRPEWIEHAGAHLLKRTHSDPHWDERRAQVWATERVTLFGLEIVPRRAVHYGPIDPKASREIFIHHALIEGQYWSNHSFWKHNKALLDEVEQLQHKLRARDFVQDVHTRFAFFDKQLPPDVYSGQGFETWHRRASRDNPRLLHMTLADLVRPGWGVDAQTLAKDYPDEIQLGDARLPLLYRYAPGAPDDGVTLIVPVAFLGLLTEARLSWLVPGMLEDKIVALMRTLPKDVRRVLVPAPDFAEKAADLMDENVRDSGDLLAALAHALSRLSGEVIETSAFKPDALPPELLFNIRVVEGDSPGVPGQAGPKVLAEGRDLPALQVSLRALVRSSLASTTDSTWNTPGLSDWTWGDLPEQVEVSRAGVRFIAYPALVDERQAARRTKEDPAASGKVALRLVDTRDAAAMLTRRGLRRLFHLKAREEIRFQLGLLPNAQAMFAQYGPIGDPKALREDLADVVAERAFIAHDGGAGVRTRAEFERRLDTGWNTVGSAAREIGKAVAGVLSRRQALALRFPEAVKLPREPFEGSPALAPSISDVRLQLAMLMPPGFVADTPLTWLGHMPRYLQAVERRLEKLQQGGAAGAEKDRRITDEIRPLWVGLLERARAHAQEGRDEPALVEFRWLLEELRVSLFAQELGTAEPVSVRRLEKRWADVPE
ncbi:MAG: ATP-dependent RNA helicase HrpA [Planctomycetota bacterium]|nr:ATP-dependent RNA helicase HrpA [Planctomycetota bacterium]